MGIFDNIAKESEKLGKKDSNSFITPGKYELRIDNVIQGTSNKSGKNYVLAEMAVLKVIEGASHEAGETVKWMTSGLPTKMSKDVARLLLGILGIEAGEITPDHANAFVNGDLNGTPFRANCIDDSFHMKDRDTKELLYEEDGSKKMWKQTALYGERALTKDECKDYDIPKAILTEL